MELRVLEYFYVVAQKGNMTKAAELLHVTQPTLSRQLMQLEEELNTKLFIRGKKGIELTEEGVWLLQNVKEMLNLEDKIRQFFQKEQTAINTVLKIGIIEGEAVDKVLMDAVGRFSEIYPKVRYDIYVDFGDDIKEKMDKGMLDLALVMEPIEISKYMFLRFAEEEEWGVLVNENDPLAKKETVDINDIRKKPLIIPKRNIINKEIISWFGVEEDELNIFVTYNLLSNISLLARQDKGYIICLRSACKYGTAENMAFVPFWPRRISHSVLIWSRNRMLNTTARLFLQFLKDFYI